MGHPWGNFIVTVEAALFPLFQMDLHQLHVH